MKNISFFCSSLLKKHKKNIKSIWFDENLISLLVSKNKREIENYAKNLLKKHNLKIKLEINFIENYFRKVLRGDYDLYTKIGKSNILYDPNHFMDPIQEMIRGGHILGTKESLIRKFVNIKEHFKQIDRVKLKVLDNIYMHIIEISQAALIERFNTICTPKQVPKYLNKYLVKNRILENKYSIFSEKTIKLFKDIEHKKKTLPSGKELDLLQKNAELFKERMCEILVKT